MTPPPTASTPPAEPARLGADATGAADRVAAQVADRLATPPHRADLGYGPRSPRWEAQSLAHGAAGVAILHAQRARDGAADPARVHPWLAAAVADELSAAPGAGPWFGAPSVAFAFRHAAPAGTNTRARDRLDTALVALTRRRLDAARERMAARRRPQLREYDVVNGLTGLGAALLPDRTTRPDARPDERSEAVTAVGSAVAREVLEYLVALTEPVDATDAAGLSVPGWWTADAPSGRPGVEGGHADLGIAHGIAGPLALLCLAARDGMTVPGHHQAIHRICRWYDQHAHPDPGPRDRDGAVCWPPRLTWQDLRSSPHNDQQEMPGRPSWCYGTPGIARALQLAGLALGDPDRQASAHAALLSAVTDPGRLTQITDVSLCHGWAGITLTTWCAARDSDDPRLSAALPHLVDWLTAATRAHPADAPPGLIHGHAGAALTLHTVARDRIGGWARCLLLT